MEKHKPLFDWSDAFYKAIPGFFHTLFIDFWFLWPILLGVVLIRRLTDGLVRKLTRSK